MSNTNSTKKKQEYLWYLPPPTLKIYSLMVLSHLYSLCSIPAACMHNNDPMICIGIVDGHRRRRQGGGLGGYSPPRSFQKVIFGQKKQVIFGQNHLIFGQAVEIFFLPP